MCPTSSSFTLTRTAARIPRERIVAIGSSLHDLYQWQRVRLPKDQSRSAMQLAEWCLQHGLTQQAAEMLIAASRLPHDSAKLQTMQLRLQQEILRKRSRQASQESHVSGNAHAAEAPPPISLPPAAMLEYTSRIQPLLLNRCSSVGCHGRGTSSDFELSRPPGRSPFTRGLTEANAARTASYINFDAPENSQLLAMARLPHGNADQAPLTRVQQQRLAQWVDLVTGRSPHSRSAAGVKAGAKPTERPSAIPDAQVKTSRG